jgi:hypothetical protein
MKKCKKKKNDSPVLFIRKFEIKRNTIRYELWLHKSRLGSFFYTRTYIYLLDYYYSCVNSEPAQMFIRT